ncbi:MAG: hypothetical protein IPM54_13195 [Polyangiaceae bacterium]|nr:hypothetical protein [Polyangiaceae bacterium]
MNELGPDAREILREGRDGDNPSPADRARIHSALMAAIVAGAAEAAAGQASTTAANAADDVGLPASVGAAKPVAVSIVGSAFAKGIFVVFVGAAGIGAMVAWPKVGAVKAPVTPQVMSNAAASVSTAIEIPPPAATAAEPSEKIADIPEVMVTAELPQKAPPARPAASITPSRTNEETADSLIAETQRLREAHGALQSGDAEKALALLSEQKAEVEGQKLREERAAARVLALCKLGRVDEANAEAAAFLAQNPRSPLAARVRKACPTTR